MAWTETARRDYVRRGLRYASDCTDDEWAVVAPLLQPMGKVGRPREHDPRTLWNAIQYIATTGCQWAQLPKEFPPFTTVQYHFYRMRDNGLLDLINEMLVAVTRLAEGRKAEPTAAIIDRSHGVDDGQRFLQNEWSFQQPLCSEVPMFKTEKSATAIQTNLAAIFVSMELSRSTWLITTLLPGNGEKMSKYSIAAGNMAELFALFSKLQERSRARTGQAWPIITIQEAGLDGFWIHRALVKEDIESHIVDAASIATPRKRRHVKTDRVDGETLLRVLMAYKRGEPRVCSMVRDISREDEDRRRIGRERKALMVERVAHVNRIKGLLFSQGITDYEPLHKNRRQRLEELRTGDGQILPSHMKAQILRELDRLELVISQIGTIEDERDALIAAQTTDSIKPSPVMMLLGIKGIGAEFANILWSEGLFRQFDNRRQVAAYAGLVPTPWQSGSVNREQGLSKAGNPGLRATLIQLSWLWLRHQPDSTLAKWFRARVERNGGRMKKTTIVALARKLLVALWKYVNSGVVIEGAIVKVA